MMVPSQELYAGMVSSLSKPTESARQWHAFFAMSYREPTFNIRIEEVAQTSQPLSFRLSGLIDLRGVVQA